MVMFCLCCNGVALEVTLPKLKKRTTITVVRRHIPVLRLEILSRLTKRQLSLQRRKLRCFPSPIRRRRSHWMHRHSEDRLCGTDQMLSLVPGTMRYFPSPIRRRQGLLQCRSHSRSGRPCPTVLHGKIGHFQIQSHRHLSHSRQKRRRPDHFR